MAVDESGLQQVFWLSQTLSATLDTEYVTVTSFDGSNATVLTNARTVLGDVRAVNTTGNSYVDSVMSALGLPALYGRTTATLIRGTDGSVGTTSFPYGRAFVEVTAINYRSMLPNPSCPLNMGFNDGPGCDCLMNTFFQRLDLVEYVTTSDYPLDQTYYAPLSFSVINESYATELFPDNTVRNWNGEQFKTWLAGDEAFKAAFPNWQDCAFWDVGN